MISLKLICLSKCTMQSHVDHICRGSTTTEQAGRSSGTLSFDGTSCEFTLTNITAVSYDKWDNAPGPRIPMPENILNIVGVNRSQSCNSTRILIKSETYCIDNTVKDTLIDVTDDKQVKFAVVSEQAEPFTLKYYAGEALIYINVHWILCPLSCPSVMTP